ncbi:hypothetical protein Tco_0662001 [Tanacetum coccineum]
MERLGEDISKLILSGNEVEFNVQFEISELTLIYSMMAQHLATAISLASSENIATDCCLFHSQILSVLLGQDLNVLETEDQDWEYNSGPGTSHICAGLDLEEDSP